jgi:molybdopterin-synthase adenylyltransferase
VKDDSRVSFLGASGLARLRASRVTVVGAGGTGSHVIQQLAHLRIGLLTVFDDDALAESNVNRVVGTDYGDVGRPKARLLARRFARLGTPIVPMTRRAEGPEAWRAFAASDVVVGASDSFVTRDVIERMCRTVGVPLVDMGLSIAFDGERVNGIGGQVAISILGGPCLRCMRVITEARLAAPREQYGQGSPEQQVIAMNAILSGQAVLSVLALITRYTNGFPVPALAQYDGLQHVLAPTPLRLPDVCPHYPEGDSGWRVVLPERKAS